MSNITKTLAALDNVLNTTAWSVGAKAHRFDLTGLTGGASTDLDSLVTLNGGDATDLANLPMPGPAYPINTELTVYISNVRQIWFLKAGTDAENVSGGIVRPDDYAASTNEKVWVRVS